MEFKEENETQIDANLDKKLEVDFEYIEGEFEIQSNFKHLFVDMMCSIEQRDIEAMMQNYDKLREYFIKYQAKIAIFKDYFESKDFEPKNVMESFNDDLYELEKEVPDIVELELSIYNLIINSSTSIAKELYLFGILNRVQQLSLIHFHNRHKLFRFLGNMLAYVDCCIEDLRNIFFKYELSQEFGPIALINDPDASLSLSYFFYHVSVRYDCRSLPFLGEMLSQALELITKGYEIHFINTYEFLQKVCLQLGFNDPCIRIIDNLILFTSISNLLITNTDDRLLHSITRILALFLQSPNIGDMRFRFEEIIYQQFAEKKLSSALQCAYVQYLNALYTILNDQEFLAHYAERYQKIIELLTTYAHHAKFQDRSTITNALFNFMKRCPREILHNYETKEFFSFLEDTIVSEGDVLADGLNILSIMLEIQDFEVPRIEAVVNLFDDPDDVRDLILEIKDSENDKESAAALLIDTYMTTAYQGHE